jgi:hypothetical protein
MTTEPVKLNIVGILEEAFQLLVRYPAGVMVLAILSIPGFYIGLYAESMPSLLLIFSFLWDTAVFFLITQYYFQACNGSDLSWKPAMGRVGSKLILLLAATFIYIVCMFAGMLLLLIPGLLILIRWALYEYPILFEDAKVIDAFKRTWTLTKGHFWRIALIMLVTYIPLVASELIPRGDWWVPLRFAAHLLFTAWWTAALLLVYLKLRDA